MMQFAQSLGRLQQKACDTRVPNHNGLGTKATFEACFYLFCLVANENVGSSNLLSRSKQVLFYSFSLFRAILLYSHGMRFRKLALCVALPSTAVLAALVIGQVTVQRSGFKVEYRPFIRHDFHNLGFHHSEPTDVTRELMPYKDKLMSILSSPRSIECKTDMTTVSAWVEDGNTKYLINSSGCVFTGSTSSRLSPKNFDELRLVFERVFPGSESGADSLSMKGPNLTGEEALAITEAWEAFSSKLKADKRDIRLFRVTVSDQSGAIRYSPNIAPNRFAELDRGQKWTVQFFPLLKSVEGGSEVYKSLPRGTFQIDNR